METNARKGLNAVKLMAHGGMPQRILSVVRHVRGLVLSQVDYGYGLIPLSKTQLARLDVIQNEGMRTILAAPRTLQLLP